MAAIAAIWCRENSSSWRVRWTWSSSRERNSQLGWFIGHTNPRVKTAQVWRRLRLLWGISLLSEWCSPMSQPITATWASIPVEADKRSLEVTWGPPCCPVSSEKVCTSFGKSFEDNQRSWPSFCSLSLFQVVWGEWFYGLEEGLSLYLFILKHTSSMHLWGIIRMGRCWATQETGSCHSCKDVCACVGWGVN